MSENQNAGLVQKYSGGDILAINEMRFKEITFSSMPMGHGWHLIAIVMKEIISSYTDNVVMPGQSYTQCVQKSVVTRVPEYVYGKVEEKVIDELKTEIAGERAKSSDLQKKFVETEAKLTTKHKELLDAEYKVASLSKAVEDNLSARTKSVQMENDLAKLIQYVGTAKAKELIGRG